MKKIAIDIDISQVLEKKRQGITIRNQAKELGISENTLYSWIHRRK